MADAAGNIYCSVGNGTFDANTTAPPIDYGMCYLKLTPNPSRTLTVEDWYAPYDEAARAMRTRTWATAAWSASPAQPPVRRGHQIRRGLPAELRQPGRLPRQTRRTRPPLQRLNGLSSNDDVGQNPIAWDTGSGSSKYVYLWPGGTSVEQFRYDPSVGNFNPPSPPTNTSSYPADVYKQTAARRRAARWRSRPTAQRRDPVGRRLQRRGPRLQRHRRFPAGTVEQQHELQPGLPRLGRPLPVPDGRRRAAVRAHRLADIVVYGLRWLMTDAWHRTRPSGSANSGGWSATARTGPGQLPAVRPLRDDSSRPARTSPPGNY